VAAGGLLLGRHPEGLLGHTGPLSRREIAERASEEYGHLGHGSVSALVTTIDIFLNAMRMGDLVVTIGGKRGEEVYIGEVAGDPVEVLDQQGPTSRRRAVRWFNPDKPLYRGVLLESLRAKLKGQRAIAELTDELKHWKGSS
jgi:predicted Mrr-cat superfamily restriction endonuclease